MLPAYKPRCLCVVLGRPPETLHTGCTLHPWVNLYWCCRGVFAYQFSKVRVGPLWTDEWADSGDSFCGCYYKDLSTATPAEAQVLPLPCSSVFLRKRPARLGVQVLVAASHYTRAAVPPELQSIQWREQNGAMTPPARQRVMQQPTEVVALGVPAPQHTQEPAVGYPNNTVYAGRRVDPRDAHSRALADRIVTKWERGLPGRIYAGDGR